MILLNLCAIHSRLDDHENAIIYAKLAIEELTCSIAKTKVNPEDSFRRKSKMIRLLAIGYYDLAVEN